MRPRWRDAAHRPAQPGQRPRGIPAGAGRPGTKQARAMRSMCRAPRAQAGTTASAVLIVTPVGAEQPHLLDQFEDLGQASDRRGP